MTIRELIAKLTSVMQEHGDIGVMLSSDAEGNSFHRVADMSCGEAGEDGWTDEGEFDAARDDGADPSVTHVVLWPASRQGP